MLTVCFSIIKHDFIYSYSICETPKNESTKRQEQCMQIAALQHTQTHTCTHTCAHGIPRY